LAEFDDDERDAVLAANRAFYRAFNDRDAAAMDQIWAATGSVICLHPGQTALYDRAEIMASWRAILKHPEAPRVRCTEEWVAGRALRSSSVVKCYRTASSWRATSMSA